MHTDLNIKRGWIEAKLLRFNKSYVEGQKFDGRFSSFTFGVIVVFHLLALTLGPITFSLANFLAFFILYIITGLGITLGYHRLLTHKSYIVENKFLYNAIVLMGVLALQSEPIEWVIDHAQHHKGSDTDEDPHNSKDGVLWAHVVWVFYKHLDNELQGRLRQKLQEDSVLVFWSQKSVFIGAQVLLGLLLLAIGGPGMVVWGIFIRTCFVWHVTWFINSVCHYYGNVAYDTTDNSKNLWWMGLLAFGEGWHNNHHKFASSPRHGLESHQVDVTYYIIWSLYKLGLVTNLRTVSREVVEKNKIST